MSHESLADLHDVPYGLNSQVDRSQQVPVEHTAFDASWHVRALQQGLVHS